MLWKQHSFPAGAKQFDLDATVVPGYIDTHAHLRSTSMLHKNQEWSHGKFGLWGHHYEDPQTGTTDVLSYSDMVLRVRVWVREFILLDLA